MSEEEIKKRHQESEKHYPYLSLGDNEYIEYAFSRAKICLFGIFCGVGALLALILVGFLFLLMNEQSIEPMGRNYLYMMLTVLVAAALLIALIAVMVYRGNRLFVTNQRVIQMIMASPVSTSLNMIDLASVEDASFHQSGLMQKLFNYGTLRLATVGDETTYTFTYASISPAQLKAVSKLITDAKTRKKKRHKNIPDEDVDQGD
ncbi:PH domain-containing protein [Candidatus Saccharibacteria bacterium]|nr:PH domain-containing protein [Candidatus Saccharibacteria bacterium]